ncbi:30S ribosomal protein S13 [Candidatus Uhrbacteria bacterium]|nr:30S ribosomal protein S13 [Candidatus Uhrbacteria bacterium]
MAFRIAGILLPQNKSIEFALPFLYGVGLTASQKILTQAHIDFSKKTKDLTEDEQQRIRELVEKNYKVEGDLRREIMGNIKHLKEMGTYRGTRHARKLPVHGQRTKTNSRTVRGNVRKTMMSGKRKLTKT